MDCKKEKFLIIISLISLSLGGCIYLFLRVTPTFAELILFKYFNFDTSVLLVEINRSNFFVRIVNIYGADFFWMFSFVIGVLFVFRSLKIFGNNCKIAALYFSFFVGFSLEILQYFSLVGGTYDTKDLLTFILAIITANFILTMFFKKGNKYEN